MFCAAYYILLMQAGVTACITQHIVNTKMVFYNNGNIMTAIIFGAFVKKNTSMLPSTSTGFSRLSPSA